MFRHFLHDLAVSRSWPQRLLVGKFSCAACRMRFKVFGDAEFVVHAFKQWRSHSCPPRMRRQALRIRKAYRCPACALKVSGRGTHPQLQELMALYRSQHRSRCPGGAR